MAEIIIKNYINYNFKIINNTIIVTNKENKNFIIDFKDGNMIITSNKEDQINQDNETNQENHIKKIVYEWEQEDNLDVCRCDDFEKMPKTKTIDEVKKRCIELGSHLFVQKPGNQYYIRSPPNIKKNRDYNSIRLKVEERKKQGRIDIGMVSYILKPFNNN